MNKIESIIFDMDDTLVSTYKIWRSAESRLFQALGSQYDFEIAKQYKGKSAVEVGRTIHYHLKPEFLSAQECGEKLREFLFKEYEKGKPELLAGTRKFLERVKGRYKLAIASGSPLECIETVIKIYGWTDLFEAAISSENVARGKPEPDVFLEAAVRLGSAPETCLVIEDSLQGAQAARRAGMRCIVIPSLAVEEIKQVADKVFQSIDLVSLSDIEVFGKNDD